MFRFRLRGLLWFTLVVALFFAWAGVRIKDILHQRTAAAKLEAKGTHVTFKRGDVVTIQPYGQIVAEDLAILQRFPRLKMLFLQDTELSDSALKHVRDFKRLEWLVLSELDITDSGVRQMSGLPRLRNLYLMGTLVTDDCVSQLATFKSLEYLNIERTAISPVGVKSLREKLPGLRIEQ